ncbi:MAG: formate dehydrogenase subunit gamma [Candidatus Eiseniibacteriota bacterium]
MNRLVTVPTAIDLSILLRRVLGAFALCWLVALAMPAHAEQRDVIIDPNASVESEQQLFRQAPRIHGRVDQQNKTSSMLEQPAGRLWRYYHEVLLHWGGAVAILGMIALLAAFYLIAGRLRISAGRSGIRILRFRAIERSAHWLTAISFVVLGLTGLTITYGKILLLPLIGPEAFSEVAAATKPVHDFTSFPFVLGLVGIVVFWLKDNVPRMVDLVWLKRGGGFVRSKHAPAGRFNAGEKLVFWFAVFAGAAVAVSGYLLLFPFYVTNVTGMQIAQVVHSLTAVLFIAVIIAHIYIGTLGMEGAFEAMGTGSVDLNWAKEHHDLWLEQEVEKGHAPASALPGAAPAE